MSEESFFLNPEKAPSLEQMPGIVSQIMTGANGERMMMVLTTVDGGCTVPEHAHPHEQIGVVYSGRARMKIGSEEREIGQGDFVAIPSGVAHSAVCLGEEPFAMVDIFSPVREDFLEKIKA